MYYEIHVIVSPPFKQEDCLSLVKPYKWWGAVINQDTGHEEKAGDLILTTRAKSQDLSEDAIKTIIAALKDKGFNPTRYKIELATLDSKLEDTLNLL